MYSPKPGDAPPFIHKALHVTAETPGRPLPLIADALRSRNTVLTRLHANGKMNHIRLAADSGWKRRRKAQRAGRFER
jgi:hypothetical protein